MEPETYTGPLWVPGKPKTKGSLNCVTPHARGMHQNLQPDSPDKTQWEAHVSAIVNAEAGDCVRNPIDAATELTVDFHLPRPKRTEFKQAPIGHNMGDLDKLVRAIGDGLTLSGVYTDDSRIARIVAEKVYTDPGKEGVLIELRPYTPPLAAAGGKLPVRVQVGRTNALVGSVDSPAELPALLRKVADAIEENQAHAPA